MLIVHISDTHIVAPNKKAYGLADTEKNLISCIEYINKLDPKVDIVLVTGDISNNGKLEELQHAKEILNNLNAPYFVIAGNHDKPEDVKKIFNEKSCPSVDSDFINYVIDGYDIRFIALDSVNPGKPGAKICSKRANWLDEELKKQPNKPTIIFMHHPPIKCNVLETDIDGFIGTELLGDIVEKYSNIKAILCGHIHLQAHISWRNTVVSVAPSTEMRLMLDLTMKKESQFYLEYPAFQIHYWTADKNLISYPILIGDKRDAYSFREY